MFRGSSSSITVRQAGALQFFQHTFEVVCVTRQNVQWWRLPLRRRGHRSGCRVCAFHYRGEQHVDAHQWFAGPFLGHLGCASKVSHSEAGRCARSGDAYPNVYYNIVVFTIFALTYSQAGCLKLLCTGFQHIQVGAHCAHSLCRSLQGRGPHRCFRTLVWGGQVLYITVLMVRLVCWYFQHGGGTAVYARKG